MRSRWAELRSWNASMRPLIREAGYAGQRIVVLSPTDFATIHPQGLVTNDLLQQLGKLLTPAK